MITDPVAMQQRILALKKNGKSIGVVPTMGALHEGHSTLIRQCSSECDVCVVTIFVNPTQFGPQEDFSNYPRDLENDAEIAIGAGADVIFNPGPEQIYPESFQTWVVPGELSEALCGKSRPGHFKGVATVVIKLLGITQPDKAYFGLKDYQQFRIIHQMVDDFNLPIQIVGAPTVREADGLAMSSRNAYLNEEEREAAVILNRSLKFAASSWDLQIRDADSLRSLVEDAIRHEKLADIEYVEVVDPISLKPIAGESDKALVAVAVRIGPARLIDNIILGKE